MDDTFKLINSLNIKDQDAVVLACSYGPDSMCLLDILSKFNIKVIVAHVNHKLRKESDDEYIKLEKYCKKNNYIFEGYIIENYPKGNTEAIARDIRYAFFDKIVKKYDAKYLFTAHHGDDLMETILMRISRGSSFKGYSGFKIITHKNNYDLIRPLTYLTKNEILKYVQDNNIPYAIDESNNSLNYTRNKYRHQILPILKDINPKIHTKFIKFSNTINEYNDYIEEEVNSLYSKLYLNNRIDLNEFNILPNLLKKCLLNKILFLIYENKINKINDEHINLILNLADNSKVNSLVNLPLNVQVIKFYNILEFAVFNEPLKGYNYIFNDEAEIELGKIIKISRTDIIKSNYLIRLDSSDITLPIHIRTRQDGDKIEVKNMDGMKKVNDIFIDNKVSKQNRDIYPIVTDGNGVILWLPGLKKSKFDKQSNERYDIILKYIKKGEKNEE